MNRSLLLFACLSLLAILPFSAQADFITVSGDVSGVWDVDSVIVTGDIRVPANAGLGIAPGVRIMFQGHYKFNIYGYLQAVGSEQDTIVFTRSDSAITWCGIRFYDSAADSSLLAYCTIEYGEATGAEPDHFGGGVYCINSSPTLEHCLIRHNISHRGGGLYCQNSGMLVRQCVISDNLTTGDQPFGGGIACHNSTAQILESTITRNENYGSDSRGGGIFLRASGNVLIENCTISDNQASHGAGAYTYDGARARFLRCIITGNTLGGGIACDYRSFCLISNSSIFQNEYWACGGGVAILQDAHVIVADCIISSNTAGMRGGGIYAYQSDYARLERCLIRDNNAPEFGGGVSTFDPMTILNCTVDGNWGGDGGGISITSMGCSVVNTIISHTISGVGLYSQNYMTPILYCSFYANPYGNSNSSLPGFGTLTQVNANGDSCDVYGNIFLDPQYVHPEQNDCRLLWGSPCIDTGDPDPQYSDPDSSRSDMGAFYYDQSVPVRVLLTPYDAPIQIPPEGGTFDYAITASNCTGSPLTADFWCDATLPSGSLTEPLMGPLAAIVPANDNVSVMRTQRVPGGMPKTVTYNGYAAVGADTSKDSFSLWRLGTRNSPLATGNWANWGEWFVGASAASGSGATPTMEFALHPASPNPFNAATVLRYELRDASFVKLCVYDISGRAVETLVNGWREAGSHEVTFDASHLASGVYVYRLQAGNFVASQKMILLK